MENTQKEMTANLSVTFSDAAREKILEALEAQEEKTALRLEARAQGGPEFSYAMRLIQDADKTPEDVVSDINGLEATKRIRASEANHDILIIALTSYAMSGDKEKTLNAGCDGYIEKPINPETFMVEVMKYL